MKNQQITRLAKAAHELASVLSACEQRMASPDAPCGGVCETCAEMKNIQRGMSIMAGGLYSIHAANAAKVARWRDKEGSAGFAAFWGAYPRLLRKPMKDSVSVRSCECLR